MKKRIFAIALVVGVMLSVCASAWADDPSYYVMSKAEAEFPNIYNIENRQNLPFNIRVRAVVLGAETGTDGQAATKVLWELETTQNQTTFSNDLVITPNSVDIPANARGYTAQATISGTLIGNTESTITFKASLHNGTSVLTDDGDKIAVKSNTIIFHPGTGSESRNTNFPAVSNDSVFTIKEVFEATETQKADPDSEFWDGIDPTYPSGDVASKAQAALEADKGAKPKLGRIDKSKLTFKAGTAGTLTIPIEGGCPVVDVYIAAKDAAKLWPDSFDKNSDNVQLNKANIKALNIPFRINAENIATGTAKTAKSSLTLAYNGANVAYKGFPITIEMTNSAASKPVKKAIKINVTPNDKVPGIYRYEDTEFTVNGLSFDMGVDAVVGTGDTPTTSTKDDNPANPTGMTARGNYIDHYGTFTFVRIDSGDLKSEDVSGVTQWSVKSLSQDATAAHVYYNFTYTAPALVLYDKKVKPKQVWDISVPLTGSGDVEESENPTTFYVSGDAIAPYIITTKGQDKNGVSVDIHQPVYDKYGNVEEMGYVTIGGRLENLEKETKTGITITATNPSTKKKGSVKINVIGKVPAKFDKSKFVDAPDAADYANASDWMKGVYSTILSTKAGAAGKVPGASFKAKGSKTIYYDVYDGLDGLKAAGLSLDVKKGKLIALTTKDKVVPTVDDDGNYSPVDLVVHAYNDTYYDKADSFARALIGVTGAKPSLADKTVTFKTADYVNGTIKTFKLNAGKEKPIKNTSTASNVKVRLADSSSTALSDLGLALIDWTSIDCVVSQEATLQKNSNVSSITSGTYKIASADGTVLTTSDYIDSTGVLQSADKVTVIYGSKTKSGDENYKNFGAIIVKDKSKMEETAKLKVNLTLDNLGAAGKGAITVVIGKAPTTSGNKSLPANSTVKVDANATAKKTNGTASLTYNGALPGEADADADESAEEATVTVGEPRTAADLTAAQQAYLAAKGLKVIAVLPEISANVEGQNKKFEVTLDEDAPEGAKMVYVPFPQDVEETEDDSIADFYDADGEPIDDDKVPAEKAITVEPWLRADVVYQPVIAAEAE